MLFRLLRPALFTLDSETGHRLALAGLKALPLRAPMPLPGRLAVEVAGLCALDGAVVVIPEAARRLMRVVAAAFDERLPVAVNRHAKAV